MISCIEFKTREIRIVNSVVYSCATFTIMSILFFVNSDILAILVGKPIRKNRHFSCHILRTDSSSFLV